MNSTIMIGKVNEKTKLCSVVKNSKPLWNIGFRFYFRSILVLLPSLYVIIAPVIFYFSADLKSDYEASHIVASLLSSIWVGIQTTVNFILYVKYILEYKRNQKEKIRLYSLWFGNVLFIIHALLNIPIIILFSFNRMLVSTLNLSSQIIFIIFIITCVVQEIFLVYISHWLNYNYKLAYYDEYREWLDFLKLESDSSRKMISVDIEKDLSKKTVTQIRERNHFSSSIISIYGPR